ncbi:leucyl/phenylalanyl-tRNA--protein transferase [Leeuwenhoekiella marinoflava DSM 3653]|uniref:Leucyl/phenylalanyl-tRNA--protein transferase n=2 Tax=Leeuwenhoekiella marinoflava TaxID=988 RepID=A0A4Q0PRJ9_9FLAO|nr:leucyl/phenylalanyl-tRNA--protein transferase [Leeuwenhoekiella marinoflava]RXG33241.1 leucyl/phenylalanyl-tRNA--protein transferase [Leeuwenhoekiella marinoflava]SHE43999.1 leucyl/phenylalanyl-tRNA--protein transferase [Leeuwenhoekiella marinoflava DSM 3653]
MLAVGAALTVPRLIDAYSKGIFPWYNDGQPVLWWSPDPRMVLIPENIHVSKTMRRILREERFKVTFNTAFLDVILNCKRIKRDGQHGTWITNEMVDAYLELHKQAYAESVEIWEGDKLVGGLYGINLKEKKVFCGESMFAKTSNASKVALITLAQKLQKSNYKLIDCQVYTEHLERMGAAEISRAEFLSFLT